MFLVGLERRKGYRLTLIIMVVSIIPSGWCFVRFGVLKTDAFLWEIGGWVIGGLGSDESWCRQVCQSLGIVIIDVDYRLAPEYPYPTQIWDSWGAFKWVFDNASFLGIDTSRVSVGGLSAGGHLAAVVALMARDDPTIPPLKLQLLVVPTVDARWIPSKEEPGHDLDKVPYKSYVSCEDAPCLPLARMIWFVELWLGSDHGKSHHQRL